MWGVLKMQHLDALVGLQGLECLFINDLHGF
jgi:hypothetical protein